MKSLKYFLILFLFLCCKKKSTNIKEPFFLNSSPTQGISPININDDENGNTFQPNCDAQFLMDTSAWCEIVQKESLLLEDVDKYWVPQYEFDIGKQFNYKNEAGQSLTLTLTKKGHLLVNRILNSERCEENSDKMRGHCYESEIFYIILKNEVEDIEFYIEMAATKDFFFEGKEIPNSVLKILKASNGRYEGALLWVEEFDRTEQLFMATEFATTQTLLDRNFENVIHNPRPAVDDYFYNKEYGLIAFEDATDVLWVLAE